jgi:hypothetical protein
MAVSIFQPRVRLDHPPTLIFFTNFLLHRCRTMIVGGEKFSWRPNGGFIEVRFLRDKHRVRN